MADKDVQILITAQDRATDALKKLTAELSTVTNKLSGVQQEATASSTALGKMANSFSILNTGIGNFVRNAVYFTVMGAAIQGMTTAFNTGLSSMVSYNAQMQDMSIGFTTMIGNAEAAQEYINQIKDFAAVTPFETKDVAMASTKLMAFGWKVKDIIPDLTTIGNAAAGLNVGTEGVNRMTLALGQLSMKAHANAQDMRQLEEVGVDALGYLGKKFNLTAADLDDLSKTGISGYEAMRAILEGMANDPKFENMMAKKSKTLTGLWSTLKDNLTEISGKIGESMSAYIGSALESLTEKTSQFVKTMRGSGIATALDEAFGTETAAKIYAVGTIVTNVVQTISNAFAFLTSLPSGGLFSAFLEGVYNVVAWLKVFSQNLVENAGYVIAYAASFAGAMVIMYSPAIVAGFGTLVTALTEVRIALTLFAGAGYTAAAASSLASLGGVAGAVGTVLATLTSPVVIASAAFLTLTAGLIYAEQKFGIVSETIEDVQKVITENMGIIFAVVSGVTASWVTWIVISTSSTWLPVVVSSITTLIGWLRSLSIMQGIQTLTTVVAQAVQLGWAGVAVVVVTAFRSIAVAAAAAWTAVISPVALVVLAVGAVVGAFVYLADTTGESGNKILTWMGRIVNAIKQAATAAWNFLSGKFDAINPFKIDTSQYQIDFEKQLEEARRQMAKLLEEARNALDNAGGRSYGFKGGDEGKKGSTGKTEIETQIDNMLKLKANLEEKIAEVSQSAPKIAQTKLSKEITGFRIKIADAQRQGVDTTEIESLVSQYEKLYGEKLNKDLLQAQKKFIAETNKLVAENSDDVIAIAKAEAEARKVELDKQVDDWRKAGMTEEDIARRTAQTKLQIEKDLTEKINNENATRLSRKLQAVENNRVINGLSVPGTMNQTTAVLLEQKAHYEEMVRTHVEGTKERAEAEKNLADTVKKLNDQNRYSMSTSYKEAIKDIRDKMKDYASIMTSTFDEINSTLESNWTKMLSGQQDFATSMKNIWKDMTQQILSMMAQILYYQMVYKPLQSFFTSMLVGGGIPNSVPDFAGVGFAAVGGYRQGWTVVGENGPELVNFSDPGRVYTADQTQKMLGGSQTPVTVNVINQSGQQVQVAKKETKFNGVETVVNLWLEGYAQNYGGMQTILGGAK